MTFTLPALADGLAGTTLVHNAVVHTVDEDLPKASALVFDDEGRILAVGETAALAARFDDVRRVDLDGAVVIPGLVDAHAHLSGYAVSLTRAQLDGAQDLAEVMQRLEAQAETLGEDDWLLGRGWDQNDWPGQAFPDRAVLDERFPDRPVWLTRIDGHAGWANSAALARVDRDMSGDWQPDGGYIHRDDDGQPTGILIDAAMGLVGPQVPPTPESLMRDALRLAIRNLHEVGITGVHDPGIDRATLARYRDLVDAGEFDMRVHGMADGMGETLDWLCDNGAYTHPSGRLQMRAVKLYEDGALGSRGAALLADYSDEPGNTGLLFHDPEALTAQVNRVLGCGLQAGIHAIGDRANRVALDALQAAMGAHPDNPGRHRIEHAQVLTAADLPRFAELGVIAAMQPTHATSDMYWAEQRLGPERSRYAYAWRSLLDSGARLALGSDFPVEAINPFLGLHAAVTRQDVKGWPPGGWFPGERMSREEALRGFTLDAAWAAFMEADIGSLSVGKRADFIVLDADLMTVPAEDIAAIRVLETWIDGRRVYERPQ
ncbi:amidohydrolase [Marinihelvus fidelis]|uniref:Amidohydrolase n=2 Tax=Marinihelvus fidelis TaxID=2613842 RepID=A0A5N0TEY8_9GAMM|nr:amidohydrolase [Marinihelvus fidelis]